MDDLLTDFLTEANEGLAELDTALLRLERAPEDAPTIQLIFRLVHTIKGTCGFLGLPRLERVAHAAENVLGQLRDGALVATPAMITTILAAIDCVKQIVGGLERGGTEPDGDDTALIAALAALSTGDAPAAPLQKAAPPSAAPSSATTPGPLPEPADPAEPAMAAQTIRVSVDVLEQLMTLVGELVLTRNQLLQLTRGQENAAWTVPMQRLSHITSDLQEGVMKTRMQPIANGWAKLPRLVRDLALDLGKKIELVMRGAETELDRQVLELIRDPLTHMVRNCADHGLEMPQDRRAAGKPETGRITLSAVHEGGHVIIGIADDGRGLPVARIRAKALARGLATEAELAAMSDAQVHGFIFHPGFSTAEEVTSVSGRGVGMDVVRTNIERIGGTIDLSSAPGAGTRVLIKIPLTLAIVAALIVEAGGERFAVPQIGVLELVRVGAGGAAIEHINATPVLRLREMLLPLVDLAELLRLPKAAQRAADGKYVVVAQLGAALLGIVVDRVFDTEEIVVKPVAPILRHLTIFGGNTILGDGSVIMILDPAGLARSVGLAASGEAEEARMTPPVAHQAARERTALLVFRAGSPDPKAVPLGLVARLEHVRRGQVEISGGAPVTQYRGRLMKLMPVGARPDRPEAWPESNPVLVFTGRDGRVLGLVVDEIVDVVQDVLDIAFDGAAMENGGAGVLGSAVIDGRATDVIDTGWWLTRAWPDWFAAGADTRAERVLVVEDSAFFRQLVTPVLAAAGYRVTGAASAAEALALRDAGARFEAILSDIDMPCMDGLDFVRALRGGGAWRDLPVIALAGAADPDTVQAAREAGFTDFVAKFERGALLGSLRQCLDQKTEA